MAAVCLKHLTLSRVWYGFDIDFMTSMQFWNYKHIDDSVIPFMHFSFEVSTLIFFFITGKVRIIP